MLELLQMYSQKFCGIIFLLKKTFHNSAHMNMGLGGVFLKGYLPYSAQLVEVYIGANRAIKTLNL